MHFISPAETFRLRLTWRVYVILLHAGHRTWVLTLAIRREESLSLLEHEKRF
jgi:hypothetical protein